MSRNNGEQEKHLFRKDDELVIRKKLRKSKK